jgi:toxin-antitoxin system PIN domain toxin
MPKSKIFLPDVNVWLALASGRHVHNRPAAEWFDGIGYGQAIFCRITQMGILRLLTSARVMGVDVVTQPEAWRVYQKLAGDPRVSFSDEPAGLEEVWQRLSLEPRAATNLWTDAYLQAFAQLREFSVVTFDKGSAGFPRPTH